MKSAPLYFSPGLAVLAAALAFASATTAQQVRARVLAPVSSAQRVPLAHSVEPRVRVAEDVGQAASATVLPDVMIRFNMTAAQQAQLSKLLEDQQNPSSPDYQKWLTPEEFAVRFGMAESDLAKVKDWLRGQGFQINQIGRARNFISFSGTVAQAQAAFATEIHTLRVDGETHIANVTDLALPSAFAEVVQSVQGISDLRPQPHYTSGTGNHFVVPGDLQTIYDVAPVYTTGVDGTGVSIVVAGQASIDMNVVNTFRSRTGLPAKTVTVKQYATPGTSSGDQVESYADLEYAGALAPGADLIFSTSNNVFLSVQYAVDNHLGAVLSMSYGTCEKNLTPTQSDYLNAIGQEAASLGITLIAASGDSGSTDCELHGSGSPASATTGLYVDMPAASPFYTGVGGTILQEGSGSYWTATNAPNFTSAKSYMPEVAWNESGTTYPIFASGGGASRSFAKPVWQVGVGVPADGKRDVPDIAFKAGAHDAFLVCVPGYCTSGMVNASGVTYGLAGTSLAAPAVAGTFALLVQKTGAWLGNVNPRLYSLAGGSLATNIFHDISSGDNKVKCTAGSTDCPSGGSIGYTASVGYDQVTGLGSLDVASLVNGWSTSVQVGAGTTASSTTVVPSSSTGTINGTLDFTASVSGAGVTPTGTVYFVVNGSTVAFNTLSAGAYRQTLTLSATNNFQLGDNTVQVLYTGDTVYTGSQSSVIHVTVGTVANTAPSFSITLAPTASVTVASGGTATVNFAVAAVNGYVGTVKFSLSSLTAGFQSCPTFSPASVSLSNAVTSANVTLALKTSSCGLAVSSVRPVSRQPHWPMSGVVVAGLLLVVLPKRRRWMPLMCAVLFAGSMVLNGCGTGVSSEVKGGETNTPVVNAPAGAYQLVVTGTGTDASGNVVTENAVLNVTVS